MVRALREGLDTVEATVRITVAILALASGIGTWLGLRGLFGDTIVALFGSLIYAAATATGIYVFWSALIRFLPHIHDPMSRRAMIGIMALGSAIIVALSSWLNAAALAGPAALERHMSAALTINMARLETAHNDARASRSLRREIELAAVEFERLAHSQRVSGAFDDASPTETVIGQFLLIATRLRQLAGETSSSASRIDDQFAQGSDHLMRMRQLIARSGPVQRRARAFADETIALAGIISTLRQIAAAPTLRHAVRGLSTSLPGAAAGGSAAAGAGEAGEATIHRLRTLIAAANAPSPSLNDATTLPPSLPQFVALSPAEAILRHAGAFIPSWISAIAIDLLPAMLILLLTVAHDAARRAENSDSIAHRPGQLVAGAVSAPPARTPPALAPLVAPSVHRTPRPQPPSEAQSRSDKRPARAAIQSATPHAARPVRPGPDAGAASAHHEKARAP
ncbi:MAG: hypothetical protein ACTSSQ_08360 [Alphaproteobacteria bacterium]